MSSLFDDLSLPDAFRRLDGVEVAPPSDRAAPPAQAVPLDEEVPPAEEEAPRVGRKRTRRTTGLSIIGYEKTSETLRRNAAEHPRFFNSKGHVRKEIREQEKEGEKFCAGCLQFLPLEKFGILLP